MTSRGENSKVCEREVAVQVRETDREGGGGAVAEKRNERNKRRRNIDVLWNVALRNIQ